MINAVAAIHISGYTYKLILAPTFYRLNSYELHLVSLCLESRSSGHYVQLFLRLIRARATVSTGATTRSTAFHYTIQMSAFHFAQIAEQAVHHESQGFLARQLVHAVCGGLAHAQALDVVQATRTGLFPNLFNPSIL